MIGGAAAGVAGALGAQSLLNVRLLFKETLTISCTTGAREILENTLPISYLLK